MYIYIYIWERERQRWKTTPKSCTIDSKVWHATRFATWNQTFNYMQQFHQTIEPRLHVAHDFVFFLTSTCMDSSECRFMNPCRCESVYVFWGLTKSRPTETDPKHPNKWYGEIFETWTKWKDHHPSQSSEVMYLLKMCFFCVRFRKGSCFHFDVFCLRV